MPEVLKSELADGLLILTLSRPEKRNALNLTLARALRDATEAAANDPSVRAVLLTGTQGHFCVGGDVAEMASSEASAAKERLAGLRERMDTVRQLHDMPKPTIAAIEGSCAGAGLSLALACDLRLCAEDAKITTAFAKIALSGDFGGSWFLTQLLGGAKARELYLTSPILTGAEAARIGLATRALPAADLQGAARQFAATLAKGPTDALGRMKENIAKAEAGSTLAECLDLEARNHIHCAASANHREAAAAFTEKRKPVFNAH
ncbi:enoyl-CoA hydratase [Martelella lutilitoris]|uniref:Enoyl-CoA hydratase n=1 Tax=Martelella lutilitoris TaxID=2583532 RepID=A0A5C4JR10_9HYPH|nr:enoyl-CoA hydratase [Martelella lutilitoris]TNB47768.1 enoyl-CoA hydratase [Martelella lutilitoris]